MTKHVLPACMAIWGVHALLLVLAFPLSALLTSAPLFHIDSPFHHYQMEVARALWSSHSLVGYDPWFAAGHIGGVNYNASGKLPALLAVLFGGALDTAQIYKLYVFASAVLAPGFVLVALRLLRADGVSSTAAMVLGVLLWWISSLHWYHTAGMVAFVLASYAALPYIALAWRSVTEPLHWHNLFALGACGALGMLVHPLFPIPVLFAMAALVLTGWHEVRVRSLLLVICVVPVLCVLPNLPWIIGSLQYPGMADSSQPFQKVVDIRIVWQEAIGRIEGAARGAKLNPVMLLLLPWAVSSLTPPRLRRVAIGLTVGAVSLAVFAALAGISPMLGTMQPNRQSAAAYLLLAIPSAIGVSAVANALKRHGGVRHLARATGVLLLATGLYFFTELQNEVSSAGTPHYGRSAPEVRGAGETTRWLSSWLSEHTTDQARVLFETSLGRIHDGAHIAGILAHDTKREFIGGPYVFMHYAGFWDGHLFGQPIEAFSADEFSDRLALYNVGWVVAHSAKSKEYLDKHPILVMEAQHGPLVIYRVQQQASYFLEGSGRVVGRGINGINFDDVEGAAVTLKYHYIKGLQAGPGVKLEPVSFPGDPKPFIRIVQPPRRFTLRFGD